MISAEEYGVLGGGGISFLVKLPSSATILNGASHEFS